MKNILIVRNFPVSNSIIVGSLTRFDHGKYGVIQFPCVSMSGHFKIKKNLSASEEALTDSESSPRLDRNYN